MHKYLLLKKIGFEPRFKMSYVQLCSVRVQLGMQGIKVKMFTTAVQCPNPSNSLYKGLCDLPGRV